MAALPADASAHADQDILLTARALGFVRDLKTDLIRVAIVRDPSSPQSVAEAKAIGTAIGHGLDVARVRMTFVDVSITKLQELGDVDVMWLTRGLRDYARIVKIASARHILSVSSDLDCVEDGYCVLGVQSEPSVKIVLNSSAASRAGIAFQPAFRMMVTER